MPRLESGDSIVTIGDPRLHVSSVKNYERRHCKTTSCVDSELRKCLLDTCRSFRGRNRVVATCRRSDQSDSLCAEG